MNFQPDFHNNEPALGQQLLKQYQEETNLFGYPYKYLQADELEANNIFSESTARNFLIENVKDIFVKKDNDMEYVGSELFNNFGYTPSYSNSIYVPQLTLEDEEIIPIEGDILFDVKMRILYEITKVDTLSETQQSLRINDFQLATKIYMKQYTFSYKDSFSDMDEVDEVLEDNILLEELDKLNDTLNNDIDDLGILDNDRTDSVFGDYN